MASDEDDDDTTFIRFEGITGADGRDAVLSRGAFMLHSFAIQNSITDGHPGFVSDDYLNAITAATTTTAAELETAGLWGRVEGGYQVLDQSTLQMAIEVNERIERMEDEDEDE